MLQRGTETQCGDMRFVAFMSGKSGLGGGRQVLEALAANLAAEQQELAHQDFVLFRELLSPVQVPPLRPPASALTLPDISGPMPHSVPDILSQPLPAAVPDHCPCNQCRGLSRNVSAGTLTLRRQGMAPVRVRSTCHSNQKDVRQ